MPRNELTKALRTVSLILAAILVASGSRASYTDVKKYEVLAVKVLADGQWESAKKKAPGQFVFEFKPSWPQPMTIYVTWGILPPTNPTYTPPCLKHSIALPKIVLIRNGQAQLGHPSAEGSTSQFTYAFANVSRSAPSTVNATCETERDPQNNYILYTGAATISFRPQDPLHDWNPGIAKPVIPAVASIEIQKPSEGEALSHGQPVAVLVKGKFPSTFSRPKKLRLELERAIKIQTGYVGDIALPGNQPYITWKAVTTLWADVNWTGLPANSQGSLQMPSNFFAEPGLYHVHVVGSPSQWRIFKIKTPIAFRRVS